MFGPRYDEDSILEIRNQIACAADPTADGSEGRDALYLAKLVNSLAYAEGYVQMNRRIDEALHHPQGGLHEAVKAVMLTLTMAADDTWSGRENETRRSFSDGQRAAVNDRLWDDLYVTAATGRKDGE